jgi:hypothetical protein
LSIVLAQFIEHQWERSGLRRRFCGKKNLRQSR